MAEPLDLDALSALEQAATPGEWDTGLVEADEFAYTVEGPYEDSRPVARKLARRDAAFIAAIRNAAPALIAELRELRAEVERLRLALTEAQKTLASHGVEQ